VSRIDQLDIVVQNVAAFRIDPAVLARPDRRTALIVSNSNMDRLRARQRTDVFDHIVVLDIFDDETVVSAVGDLLDREGHRVERTRLLCHDEYSLRIAALVREKLGITGDQPRQVAAFTDKIEMKAVLAGAGIRTPRHVAWDEEAYRAAPDAYREQVLSAVGTPAFVKPVDESGSVGAQRIDSGDQLRAWAERDRADTRFEVDEYVTGTLYHVDSVVCDGSLVHAQANRYLHPCYDYVSGRVCSSYTLPETDPYHQTLLDFNRRVLDALTDKPQSSVFHHEIFATPAGELVFLEIAARAPAALVPATSRIRWGADIEETHFRLQRGERVEVPVHRGPFAGWVYLPKRRGTVTKLREPSHLESPYRWKWNVSVGDVLDNPEDIRDFAAAAVLWNEDPEALVRDLERLDRFTPMSMAAG
jgi:hypothetical protein